MGLHVSVILDGNRRFAKQSGKKPWEGHREGADNVKRLIEWCPELGISELTLYTFSLDNFNRNEVEKKALFSLFKEGFAEFHKDPMIEQIGIRIEFIGRIEMFPKDLQTLMHNIMEKTSSNSNLIVRFAMAYGGRAEITDAVKKIAEKKLTAEEITEKTIQDNLSMATNPDILIRPGGEQRISDFLLWQHAYTEFFFLEKLWPEVDKKDIVTILDEFKARERRFGR